MPFHPTDFHKNRLHRRPRLRSQPCFYLGRLPLLLIVGILALAQTAGAANPVPRIQLQANVAAIYQGITGSAPSASVRDRYVGFMENHGWSYDQVRAEIQKEHDGRNFIVSKHNEYLGRNPSQEEFNLYFFVYMTNQQSLAQIDTDIKGKAQGITNQINDTVGQYHALKSKFEADFARDEAKLVGQRDALIAERDQTIAIIHTLNRTIETLEASIVFTSAEVTTLKDFRNFLFGAVLCSNEVSDTPSTAADAKTIDCIKQMYVASRLLETIGIDNIERLDELVNPTLIALITQSGEIYSAGTEMFLQWDRLTKLYLLIQPGHRGNVTYEFTNAVGKYKPKPTTDPTRLPRSIVPSENAEVYEVFFTGTKDRFEADKFQVFQDQDLVGSFRVSFVDVQVTEVRGAFGEKDYLGKKDRPDRDVQWGNGTQVLLYEAGLEQRDGPRLPTGSWPVDCPAWNRHGIPYSSDGRKAYSPVPMTNLHSDQPWEPDPDDISGGVPAHEHSWYIVDAECRTHRGPERRLGFKIWLPGNSRVSDPGHDFGGPDGDLSLLPDEPDDEGTADPNDLVIRSASEGVPVERIVVGESAGFRAIIGGSTSRDSYTWSENSPHISFYDGDFDVNRDFSGSSARVYVKSSNELEEITVSYNKGLSGVMRKAVHRFTTAEAFTELEITYRGNKFVGGDTIQIVTDQEVDVSGWSTLAPASALGWTFETLTSDGQTHIQAGAITTAEETSRLHPAIIVAWGLRTVKASIKAYRFCVKYKGDDDAVRKRCSEYINFVHSSVPGLKCKKPRGYGFYASTPIRTGAGELAFSEIETLMTNDSYRREERQDDGNVCRSSELKYVRWVWQELANGERVKCVVDTVRNSESEWFKSLPRTEAPPNENKKSGKYELRVVAKQGLQLGRSVPLPLGEKAADFNVRKAQYSPDGMSNTRLVDAKHVDIPKTTGFHKTSSFAKKTTLSEARRSKAIINDKCNPITSFEIVINTKKGVETIRKWIQGDSKATGSVSHMTDENGNFE